MASSDTTRPDLRRRSSTLVCLKALACVRWAGKGILFLVSGMEDSTDGTFGAVFFFDEDAEEHKQCSQIKKVTYSNLK